MTTLEGLVSFIKRKEKEYLPRRHGEALWMPRAVSHIARLSYLDIHLRCSNSRPANRPNDLLLFSLSSFASLSSADRGCSSSTCAVGHITCTCS